MKAAEAFVRSERTYRSSEGSTKLMSNAPRPLPPTSILSIRVRGSSARAGWWLLSSIVNAAAPAARHMATLRAVGSRRHWRLPIVSSFSVTQNDLIWHMVTDRHRCHFHSYDIWQGCLNSICRQLKDDPRTVTNLSRSSVPIGDDHRR